MNYFNILYLFKFFNNNFYIKKFKKLFILNQTDINNILEYKFSDKLDIINCNELLKKNKGEYLCIKVIGDNIPEKYFRYLYKLKLVIISSNIKTIGNSSFEWCKNLKNVIIENNSIENISIKAFCNCENLENIYFGNKLKTIKYRSFYNCINLKELEFPNSLEKIEDEVFLNCENIKNINFSEFIKTIGNRSFYKCKNLIEIDLPKSLLYLGEQCFAYCEKLKEIELKNKNIDGCYNIYIYCKKLEKFIIPDSKFIWRNSNKGIAKHPKIIIKDFWK